jgi:hypothetical protein
MSLSVGLALFAYLLSVVCALVVSKRSSNRRIRLLALTVSLLPLCQTLVLLGRHQIWLSTEIAEMAESFELLVGALCLTAIHLLNRENSDRRNTDVRLRVAEATPAPLLERRKEPRLIVKQDVTITVLGQMIVPMQASVLDISGSGMRLHVPAEIPCGAGIKIASKNALVLAEVIRCVREEHSYAVAVTLMHSLSVFRDLEVLNRALFGEAYNRSEVESPARS